MSIKKLCMHPLFLLGLAIRLALIFTIIPLAVGTWYEPFLQTSTLPFTLDPWAAWLHQGGTPTAFPYGYVMWLTFLPLTFLCKLLGLPLFYAYSFTLFAADASLFMVLRKLSPDRDYLLLAVYWLSPIILLASYALGFNDLIPILFLMLSLQCVRRLHLFAAGALCIASISAKLSMILALPFFLIYLIRNRAMRQLISKFIKGSTIAFLLFFLPFLFSPSGLHMLLSNPKMNGIYELTVNLGEGTLIYVVPLFLLVMLYLAWRIHRLNFELFQTIMGVTFLSIVLLMPFSPGWFIWVVPFLVLYQATTDITAIVLCGFFSILYLLNILLTMPLILFQINSPNPHAIILFLSHYFGSHTISLVSTTMIGIGIVLVMRIWRDKIHLNDYFRLSRNPFVIGIAGDSSAGKDTFSNALSGLFGIHSVATLSGDNYHLWDRQKPMWQVMTHLNPMGNNLNGFISDLASLIDGKSILSRHYDHDTGKMSRPRRIKSNDFIIASGLHALYSPMLRDCYDLKIYLDIDENLRRYFKLQRDVHQRGHSTESVMSSLEQREPDSTRFIRPQAQHANLILTLQPTHPCALENLTSGCEPPLKLLVRFNNDINIISIARVLIGICGLHIDMIEHNDSATLELAIEGEISKEDIALAADMLCSRALEFLDIEPKWRDGMLGIMQLMTLIYINQLLAKRLV